MCVLHTSSWKNRRLWLQLTCINMQKKKHTETDAQISHLQLLHSVLFNITTPCKQTQSGHLIKQPLSLSLSLPSISLSICVLWSSPFSSPAGDACLALGTFPFLRWPVPRCICRGSSLSRQKAQRKKIRKLSIMKTRSTVSFSTSSSHSLLCHELGKTREEEN